MRILLTTTSFQDTPGKHHQVLADSGVEVIRARGPLSEQQMLDLITTQGPFDGFLNGDDEITKQVIAEGENSLTPAQKFAFQRNVLRKFVTQKCQNGCDISWPEQYEALLNGGFCFYCYYGMTNYRDE